MRDSSGCGTGANETRHWWLAMTSELSFWMASWRSLLLCDCDMPRSWWLAEMELEAEWEALDGLAPMALLGAVLSAVNEAAEEMSKLERVPTVDLLSRCWLPTPSSMLAKLGFMSLEGRALPLSPMGASGADASFSVLEGVSDGSAFSAPTASTMRSLVRLPPKALGMNALTLGGKRERIEVKRPGSEDAGGSGAAEAAGVGRAPRLEPDRSASRPKPDDDEGVALPFALVESDTKLLLAPTERGMVKEVE